MAHDVFISYSAGDKPAADAVCVALESRGIRCWIAPRDVLPGEEYAAAIVSALHNSRVIVLVFSSGANQSQQVLREVERGVSGGLPIIPLRIENVPPSAAMEYYISSRHWLDAFTPPLEQHLVHLADTVKLLLSRTPGSPAPPAPMQEVKPVPSISAELPVEKDRKLRYQSAADIRKDLLRLKGDTESGRTAVAAAETGLKPALKSTWFRWGAVTGATVLVIGLAVGGWLFHSRKAHALTDKDIIVLADFTNTTGDPIFDDTLRQGLAVQLEQSPFLSLVSEEQIQQTLRLMQRPPDTRLSPEIAREICQRTNSAAVLDGSIAQFGTQYSLIVKAVNCSNGESLTSTEVQASDKSQVLVALGKASSDIRQKLGESLATVQKFDTPLERATTSSMEALQAYSLGWKLIHKGDLPASIPFFRQAIKLDPNFAMAYLLLAGRYDEAGDTTAASETMRKAFELRANVSERERVEIEATYYLLVTGDLIKAQQASEVWAQTYPRDWEARNLLGNIYEELGQFDAALAEYNDALRLYPGSGLIYGNLAYEYIVLNRFEEARTTLEEAKAKNPDSPFLRMDLYQLAFLLNDGVATEQQLASTAGKPALEGWVLAFEAATAAYPGRLKKARDFSRQAVASAERAQEVATAAGYEADAALREALFGNGADARQWAESALRYSRARDVQYEAALALALAGEKVRTDLLTEELGKRFPVDTIVKFNYLPTLHAQLALNRNDSSKAIEALQAAAPYELGTGAYLYPVYVRGEAYLTAHQGSEAAAEFQKILDHRGVVGNSPIGALAHLQLGRAYAMQGDTAKAKAAYQDFLTLWKDADPDIPILKQARAEYAKLK